MEPIRALARARRSSAQIAASLRRITCWRWFGVFTKIGRRRWAKAGCMREKLPDNAVGWGPRRSGNASAPGAFQPHGPARAKPSKNEWENRSLETRLPGVQGASKKLIKKLT